jgi:hypothetical protein
VPSGTLLDYDARRQGIGADGVWAAEADADAYIFWEVVQGDGQHKQSSALQCTHTCGPSVPLTKCACGTRRSTAMKKVAPSRVPVPTIPPAAPCAVALGFGRGESGQSQGEGAGGQHHTGAEIQHGVACAVGQLLLQQYRHRSQRGGEGGDGAADERP